MATLSRPTLRAATERSARHAAPPLHAPEGEQPSNQLSSRSTRNRDRKRSAAALSAVAPPDARPPRPPTKVTVTQPHGELRSITNGVPAMLGLRAGRLVATAGASGATTPGRGHGTGAGTGAGTATAASLAPPTATQAAQDKRSLRSRDGGSRLKSDLATYFANYDEIIAGAPEPSDLIDLETPISLFDEPPRPAKRLRTASPEPSRRPSRAPASPRYPSHPPLPPSQTSTTFQVLDYSTIARHVRDNGGEDPLADSVFLVQHRRAERKEKQLRNIEKERAMHEKQQLERLLDGLLGPDWLKVMGVTGVTDGERRDWEPKRDYFVKEVEALVDKFRIWKDEEKRLRAEKEAAIAAREGEGHSEESSVSDLAVTNVPAAAPSPPEQRVKDPKPTQPRRPPRPHGFVLPSPPVEPQGPFTSFYAKPTLRAAALGKHRNTRNATAFGRPIPNFTEHEFAPPDDYITPDALRGHARKKRRQNRESGVSVKA